MSGTSVSSRLRGVVIALLVVIAAATCVRLGFWQLSRWHHKLAVNEARRSALAQPPLALSRPLPDADALRDRRVSVHGLYDGTHQILLTGREYQGEPGVGVVTPLLLERASEDSTGRSTAGGAENAAEARPPIAVLIERGWIPALDITQARLQDVPAPGERTVEGVVMPMERGKPRPPLRVVRSESLTVISMIALHYDSLSARLPYTIAPYVVRELPDENAPPLPRRFEPEFLDPTVNLSYAVQWFVFSVIILGGAIAYRWSRRRAAQRSTLQPTVPTDG